MLRGDVDLQTDIQRGGVVRTLLREPLRDLQAVERVYPGEALGYRTRFVGLQPANEVPCQWAHSRVGQPRKGSHLGERLLRIALPELCQPRRRRRADDFDRLTLAHRKECDRVDTPSGPGCGCGYAISHLGDALQQILRIH